MSLTVASIVKNEADRFLPKALDIWAQFADRIVVLDDGSTDGTPDLLRDKGVEAHFEAVGMFGEEWKARKRLFELATAGSEYVLWLDADQIPANDPKPYIRGPVFAFRLYDLWSKDQFRSDYLWRGHTRAWWRGIDARCFTQHAWTWAERGWHSGHLPADLAGNEHEMPNSCSILHYAYATPELRAQKAEMYTRLGPHLTNAERIHAKSILFPRPQLYPLPFEPAWSLL